MILMANSQLADKSYFWLIENIRREKYRRAKKFQADLSFSVGQEHSAI